MDIFVKLEDGVLIETPISIAFPDTTGNIVEGPMLTPHHEEIDLSTDDEITTELDPKWMAVGIRTQYRAKAEPGLVKKIADPAIFNQSSGKSVSIFPRGSRGPGKTLKRRSQLHLTSKG
jgi:hypothetical protein